MSPRKSNRIITPFYSKVARTHLKNTLVRAILTAIFFPVLLHSASAKLSPLATAPDWSELDKFQRTIARAEFQSLLEKIYAPDGASAGLIVVGEKSARIATSPGKPPYILEFAAPGESKAPPRFWKTRAELPARPANKPLAGLKIALDPGHIGGKWAKMEERWFQIGDSVPVVEGDMVLRVAKLIIPRLQALGAEVALTRTGSEPATKLRPAQLRKAAAAALREKGERATPSAVTKESEKLFYRTSEIRRRAEIVNTTIRPDLVLCLHFNAEPWGNPARPSLVSENHLHFLITGAWSRKELEYEDQRHEMLYKLLSRSFDEEKAATKTLAKTMAAATGLPPYIYTGGTVVRIDPAGYIWARNLLANRLFRCPVIYAEPYVMNSREVFRRVQAGDFEGVKTIAGRPRRSIYREYADAIAAGLAAHYRLP
jgi:N-acetylmuramoyl-L-alanine amidase